MIFNKPINDSGGDHPEEEMDVCPGYFKEDGIKARCRKCNRYWESSSGMEWVEVFPDKEGNFKRVELE